MKKRTLESSFTICSDRTELSDKTNALLDAALDACSLSYAPYSKFYVGAAILLENGTILKGANQENGSYPLCNCAEQVVLNFANMSNPGSCIKAMAVTVQSEFLSNENPVPPCGACRQIISEQEHRQGEPMKLYLMGKAGLIYIFDGIGPLLPLSFSFSND